MKKLKYGMLFEEFTSTSLPIEAQKIWDEICKIEPRFNTDEKWNKRQLELSIGNDDWNSWVSWSPRGFEFILEFGEINDYREFGPEINPQKFVDLVNDAITEFNDNVDKDIKEDPDSYSDDDKISWE